MNEEIRFLPKKNQDEITREWDLIAPVRDAQVAAALDRSFSLVLEPWVLRHLGFAKTILDVGCGTGRLTTKLQRTGGVVVGLDPSSASIEIARSHDSLSTYHTATVEDWAESNSTARFDLVIANMVLMDTLQLDVVCAAIAQLGRGGRLLATFTHPAFWPLYWGYASNPEFDYSHEVVVEAPFRTSSHDFALPSTHVHRSLGSYLNAFRSNGLDVTHFEELRGPEPVTDFPFPRFVCIEATINDAAS